MPILIPKKNTRRGQAEQRQQDERARQRFMQRKSWFITEHMRQRANRYQMLLDEMYYDGDQYLPHERATIEARGQAPVVYNECKPLVDFMIGTERRSRVDFTVTHRTDNSEQAQNEARAKTQLLKYIDDLNRTQFERSEAADDCFKAGLGWMEVGVRQNLSEFAIYKRSESWKNMLYDSLGRSRMPDDWRFLFRFREIDFDIAEAIFPGKADLLQKAVINADTRAHMQWFNGDPMTGMSSVMEFGAGMPLDKWTSYDADAWLTNPRRRVLIIECWSTEPHNPRFEGGSIGEDEPITMRKRVALMTEHDTLTESWSPYAHERYPFIPVWCYRRKKDGAPYGMIRQHRGPQDMLNRHMSKAFFRMAVRQVHVEENALDNDVMDIDELKDRVADPSSVMQWADGAVSGGKFKIIEGAQLVQAEIAMAEQQRMHIRNTSVPTEARGMEPGNVSGKAREIRRDQQTVMNAEPFDNLLLARQLEGELTLSLAEQYVTEPMTFSVPGAARSWDYVEINKRQPDGTMLNDITRAKAQFVIGEAPWAQDLAEAAFESMMAMLGEVAKMAPQAVLSMLDVVMDLHPNLPKKGIILQRIRQVTGMQDPDEPETPEVQQRRMQEAKLAQARFEAELAGLRAQIREAEAKGQKLSAEAVAKSLESLYMAAQAAQVLAQAPAIAPIADELTKSAGFQDKNGDAALGGAPVPTIAAPAVPDAVQGDGALAGHEAGIESPEITGVRQGVNPQ